jgi:membrane protein implicated in regulation of membrane protease activity
MLLPMLRRVLLAIAAVLIGGALAWAPIAAFAGDMVDVSKAALAGVALLVVAKLLPRAEATRDDRSDEGRDEP